MFFSYTLYTQCFDNLLTLILKLQIYLMVFDIVPYLHENYHVWVVKTPWASYIKEMALVFAVIIDNFRHTIPGVLNVIIVSPNIATLCNGFVIWLKNH